MSRPLSLAALLCAGDILMIQQRFVVVSAQRSYDTRITVAANLMTQGEGLDDLQVTNLFGRQGDVVIASSSNMGAQLIRSIQRSEESQELFDEPILLSELGSAIRSLAIGNINRDGKADFVAAVGPTSPSPGSSVRLSL